MSKTKNRYYILGTVKVPKFFTKKQKFFAKSGLTFIFNSSTIYKLSPKTDINKGLEQSDSFLFLNNKEMYFNNRIMMTTPKILLNTEYSELNESK